MDSTAGRPPDRSLIAFNGILILLLSAVLSQAIALYTNTLTRHREWTVSKTQVARSLMGAFAFESLQQPLAGNRLNLGAWFGYQELIFAEPGDLAGVSLDFWLDEGAYLHVLYDRDANGFSGLRLSHRADYPSIQYRATPQAEFLERTPLDRAGSIKAGDRHTLEIDFSGQLARVRLDDQALGEFPRPMDISKASFGFRGGQRSSWVDNVEWVESNGDEHRETFSNPDAVNMIVLCVAGVAIGALLLALGLRRVGMTHRLVGFVVATTLMVLSVLSGLAYVAQYNSARAYPNLTAPSQEFERVWIKSSYKSILEEIAARHQPSAADDTERILIVGGSQTWGAGALLDSDNWVRRTEDLLNARSDGNRFECINGGVSGYTSADIVEALRNDLLAYQPSAVVMNIGNNDLDRESLAANFSTMLDLLEVDGIAPILVLEPNSPEKRLDDSRHGSLIAKHRVLAKLASDRGVPIIDMHALLAEARNTGILWWDFSHLTSYGQRVFAERLSERLPAMLDLKSAPAPTS